MARKLPQYSGEAKAKGPALKPCTSTPTGAKADWEGLTSHTGKPAHAILPSLDRALARRPLAPPTLLATSANRRPGNGPHAAYGMEFRGSCSPSTTGKALPSVVRFAPPPMAVRLNCRASWADAEVGRPTFSPVLVRRCRRMLFCPRKSFSLPPASQYYGGVCCQRKLSQLETFPPHSVIVVPSSRSRVPINCGLKF